MFEPHGRKARGNIFAEGYGHPSRSSLRSNLALAAGACLFTLLLAEIVFRLESAARRS